MSLSCENQQHTASRRENDQEEENVVTTNNNVYLPSSLPFLSVSDPIWCWKSFHDNKNEYLLVFLQCHDSHIVRRSIINMLLKIVDFLDSYIGGMERMVFHNG